MKFNNTNPDNLSLSEIREEAYNQGIHDTVDKLLHMFSDDNNCISVDKVIEISKCLRA